MNKYIKASKNGTLHCVVCYSVVAFAQGANNTHTKRKFPIKFHQHVFNSFREKNFTVNCVVFLK